MKKDYTTQNIDKVQWFKYSEISKVNKEKTKMVYENYFRMSSGKRFWLGLMFGCYPNKVYDHGLLLINEKGETKEVWEKS